LSSLHFNVAIDEEKKLSKYEIVVRVEKTEDLITNDVSALRPKAATQHTKVVPNIDFCSRFGYSQIRGWRWNRRGEEVIVRGYLNCVGMLSEAKRGGRSVGQRAHLSYGWKEQSNTRNRMNCIPNP
jgi:hypothetical protein